MSIVRDITRKEWLVDRYVTKPARQCGECMATWWPKRSPVHRPGCLAAEVRMTPRTETDR